MAFDAVSDALKPIPKVLERVEFPQVWTPAANVDAGDRVFFDNCAPEFANWYFVVSASTTVQNQVLWMLYRDGVKPFMTSCEPGKRVRVVRSVAEETL